MSTGARTNVGDNSLSLMRATLRAPPSKWAIEAFFPESPCRVLSLVLSFASKESTTPLGAAAPPPAPESARQSPPGQEYAPAGTPKGFPRGKQSARFALPCAPLVVCLNSGSLTAFGGCIHWIPASLRSPLETFGHRSLRETHGSVSQTSAPSVGASCFIGERRVLTILSLSFPRKSTARSPPDSPPHRLPSARRR